MVEELGRWNEGRKKLKRHGFRAMPLILSAVLTDEHASLISRVISPPINIGKREKTEDFGLMAGTACLTMSCRRAGNHDDRQLRLELKSVPAR
jgi:hypothetical protein